MVEIIGYIALFVGIGTIVKCLMNWFDKMEK